MTTPNITRKPRTRLAMLIFYKSEDDGRTWEPVLPADVPEWCKEPDYVARLVAGQMASKESPLIVANPQRKIWYRAVKAALPEQTGETRQ